MTVASLVVSESATVEGPEIYISNNSWFSDAAVPQTMFELEFCRASWLSIKFCSKSKQIDGWMSFLWRQATEVGQWGK